VKGCCWGRIGPSVGRVWGNSTLRKWGIQVTTYADCKSNKRRVLLRFISAKSLPVIKKTDIQTDSLSA